MEGLIATQMVTLRNGLQMPMLAFGTYQLKNNAVEAPLEHALTRCGYRGFDTAFVYYNEENIGAVMRRTLKEDEKSDLFVITKLWRSHYSMERKDVEKRLEDHLQALCVGKLSLWLLHWPGPGRNRSNNSAIPSNWSPAMRVATFRHMCAIAADHGDKVGAVGVCNFTVAHLEELEREGLVPAVNQIETHPLLPEWELRDYCKKKGIVVQAYCR